MLFTRNLHPIYGNNMRKGMDNQIGQLMQILQEVKIGQQGDSSSEPNVIANCPGINSLTLFLLLQALKLIFGSLILEHLNI